MELIDQLDLYDKVFLGSLSSTILLALILFIIGFVFRFGAGFGTFAVYAKQNDDFLELNQLDMIFGLFITSTIFLVLSFFAAGFSAVKKNKHVLRLYCAITAFMIVLQLVNGLLAFTYSNSVNQLASDVSMYESILKANKALIDANCSISNDPDLQFWSNTQNSLGCCGVFNSSEWQDFSRERYCSVKDATGELELLNCYQKHYSDGCQKVIRSQISKNAQFLGAASIVVLIVEIIAISMAVYRVYTFADPDTVHSKAVNEETRPPPTSPQHIYASPPQLSDPSSQSPKADSTTN
uniref:Tetraspanin n=1 Tax=Caenorhabditis japonica TaxID=281687 RepID=A0A8R1DU59_CAEJA